jgi:transposase InsO family protein
MGFMRVLHQEWHIDISYVNVLGTFLFLMVVIDGYSRYIVAYDLRASMSECWAYPYVYFCGLSPEQW